MEGEELRLDGNAIAGTLGEVFVHEMTSARIACKGCSNVESVANGFAVQPRHRPVSRGKS